MNGKQKLPPRKRAFPYSFNSFKEEIISLLDDECPRESYLKAEIFSKLRDPAVCSPKARRDAAILKWLGVEERNQRTNLRLMFEDTEFSFGSSSEILEVAKRFITDVIGNEPEGLLYGAFTNGASTAFKRDVTNVPRKWTDATDVTLGAKTYVEALTGPIPFWNPKLTVVRGNHLFTVPKSSDIDRCAAKEPDLNLYAQKGVGDFIRQRLKGVGIDLNDQQVNQRMAKEASKTGSHATIDLSSASDSLTIQLACRVLPAAWWMLLMDLRSPETLIPGPQPHWHVNEMLSSMGNGFTFELESLIFWAISCSVSRACRAKGRISVYGDDIIVPVKAARPLIQVLGFCGFKTNLKKTFYEGPFRESCGVHAYKGVDITPFYVREIPDTVDRWILIANRLRAWAAKDPVSHVLGMCDPKWFALWQRIMSNIPRPLHGGWDTDSLDTAVAYGVKPLAIYRRKSGNRIGKFDQDARGFYLQWLNAADKDDTRTPGEVSTIRNQYGYELRRPTSLHSRVFGTAIPFPQEM